MGSFVPARPARPLALLLLFFFSGTSGLIYEVVWFRMLIRTFGVTVYAVSTVLAVYMAGLAAGSLLIGRWLRGPRDLLRLYGKVELLVGVTALASTRAMIELPALYHATPLARSGEVGQTLARVTLAAIVLAAPTFLMGATLPLISSYVAERRGALGRQVGFLYGANTLGAVVGVLGSGFVLLAVLGEQRTVWLAVAINVAVGVLAWMLSTRRADAPGAEPAAPPSGDNPYARTVLIVYAISGFCALSYEVVWSRILSLLLGNSVYGFSLMLGAYLTGVGLGSLVISRWVDRVKRPLFLLALLEVAVSLLALGSLFLTTAIGLAEDDRRFTYTQIDRFGDFYRMGLHALVIVVPVTIVLGAMFPVAGRLCARAGEPAERSIGRLYGYNTIGAIFGSFVTGFVLFKLLGTLLSFLFACAVSLGLGLYLLRKCGAAGERSRYRMWALISGLAFVCAISFSFRDPFYTVLRARLDPREKTLAYREDPSATVTVTGESNGQRHLYINGINVSDTTNYLADVLVAMPLAFHPAPARALIVGLGEGDAFQGAIDYGLDTTVVDLQPSVVEAFKRFTPNQDRYTESPKAHLEIADGRNFLLGSDARFDLVLVDVTPPVFASGMVNLYSKEFVRLVREHLTPQGVFALWFPVTCFESDFWMIARNFSDELTQISVWTAPRLSGIILLGSMAPDPIFEAGTDVLAERIRARPSRDHLITAPMIRQGQILSAQQLRDQAGRYPAVTDDHPYTEFPLMRFYRKERYWRTNRFLYDLAARLRRP